MSESDNHLTYLSIDPSLRNTAIVHGIIREEKLVPLGYILIHTQKSKDKKATATDDLVARCKHLYGSVTALLRGRYFDDAGEALLQYQNPDFIFVESPSGAQSFKSGVSYAVSCFLIATLHPSAFTVTPHSVKKYSCGNTKATKEEMIEWAQNTYPDFKLPMYNGKINKGKAEHVADALAVGYVGFQKLNS